MIDKMPSPGIISNAVLTLLWKLRGFPVDSVNIAKQLGVRALKARLPEGVAASMIKNIGGDPTILVDEFDSDNRKRFLFAKMLGYHLLRLEMDSHEPIICYRDSMFLSSDNEERFAIEFAINLLLPPEELDEMRDTTGVEFIAHFGIPSELIKLIDRK